MGFPFKMDLMEMKKKQLTNQLMKNQRQQINKFTSNQEEPTKEGTRGKTSG
jgi:hypothetical protein